MIRFVLVSALALFLVSSAGLAQKKPTGERIDPYICPHNAATSTECFLDAIDQTYTMCRQVKSIEIIEFGLDKSQEGVNGAKSEYCVIKHRQLIAMPFEAALHESAKSPEAVKTMRELLAMWQKSMAQLTWTAPETDDDYKLRVAAPYAQFRAQAELVRTALKISADAAAAQAQAEADKHKKVAAPQSKKTVKKKAT